MSTTDTRAAFEAYVEREENLSLKIYNLPHKPYQSSTTQRAFAAFEAGIVYAATEAAKATGTAAPDTDIFDLIREWAALPEGQRYNAARAIIGSVNRSYSAGVADGKALGEAARQPAPAALSDEQIFAIHDSTNDAGSQILAFARAILAASTPTTLTELGNGSQS